MVSLETLRGISTVLALIAFIAICLWAYSSKRRDEFEQAANLPFADELTSANSAKDYSAKHSVNNALREATSSREESSSLAEPTSVVEKKS